MTRGALLAVPTYFSIAVPGLCMLCTAHPHTLRAAGATTAHADAQPIQYRS